MKGHSANPGGRTKGYKRFAKDILKETGQGQELLDYLLKVFRADKELGGVTLKDRHWAAEQLLNRGLGRPPQVVEIDNGLGDDVGPTSIPMDQMSDAELEAIEKAADVLERHAKKRVIDV